MAKATDFFFSSSLVFASDIIPGKGNERAAQILGGNGKPRVPREHRLHDLCPLLGIEWLSVLAAAVATAGEDKEVGL